MTAITARGGIPVATWWAGISDRCRISLLDEVIADTLDVAPEWVVACCQAKRIDVHGPLAGEEWLAGPVAVLRTLRRLRQSFLELDTHGRVRLPASPRLRGDQWVVPVLPASGTDRLVAAGMRCETWLMPGAEPAALEPEAPGVTLVLGGGNVSSIPALDALYKLFAERRAVVLKLSPVNAYLAPLLARAFRELIRCGALRIVTGDAAAGAALVDAPSVGAVHVTGSHHTYDAIVFGPGGPGAERKASGRPILEKPVTAELGNVMPVIVAPGRWSAAEIEYHARHLATMLVNNAGFNCVAARVIVTWRDWPQREALLDALRRALSALPPRHAYYPGAARSFETFTAAHPHAERFGQAADGELPWTLIADLDERVADDPCFTTEAFCSVFAEVPLAARSAESFLDAAAAFANERLWGTLAAVLLVPAKARLHAAVERAVTTLRYGFVGVNVWAGVGFAVGNVPWGAYPGHLPTDIQSGVGTVHNTLLLAHPEKSVARAPSRALVTPPWFRSHRRAAAVGRHLAALEADPRPRRVPALAVAAMRP